MYGKCVVDRGGYRTINKYRIEIEHAILDAWETMFLRLWYCQHIERISQRIEWIFLTKVIIKCAPKLEIPK